MTIMFTNKRRLAFAAGAIALCLANLAEARELKLAPAIPEGTPIYAGIDAFAKDMEERTDGEVTFQIFPMSLLSIPQMLNGLRDGVADVGFVLPTVFVAELPESNFISDLAMLGTSATAQAGAATEYFLTCEACQKEFSDNGIVYLGSAASPPYDLLGTKPLVKPEDFAGAKLRSANAMFNRWAQYFGAVALSMPVNEVFEALKQGAVDATMNNASDMTNYRFIDVVTDVTIGAPGGTYHTGNVTMMHKPTWTSLSDEEKEATLAAAALGMAVTTVQYVTTSLTDVERAREQGINIHEPSEELKQMTQEFIEKDLATIADVARDQRGIDDPEGKIARFQELITKWEALVEPAGNDIDALAKIYQDELMAKIDLSTYAN